MNDTEIKNSDWHSLNGKQILRFYGVTPEVKISVGSKREGASPLLRFECLGNHTEIWVAVLINGKENARYNIRMINSRFGRRNEPKSRFRVAILQNGGTLPKKYPRQGVARGSSVASSCWPYPSAL
jgi:hypothetical protein